MILLNLRILSTSKLNWRADRDWGRLVGSGFNLVIERNWLNDHKTSYFPIFRWININIWKACFHGFSDDTGWHFLMSDVSDMSPDWGSIEQGQYFIVIHPTLCLCWILKVNGAFMLAVACIHTWFSYLYVHIYMHNWANSSKLTSCYCIQMTRTNKQKSMFTCWWCDQNKSASNIWKKWGNFFSIKRQNFYLCSSHFNILY